MDPILLAIYLVSAILYALVFLAKPYMILRPSFLYAGYVLAFQNFAAAFFDMQNYIYGMDGRNMHAYEGGGWVFEFTVLSLLFPIGICLWNLATPSLSRRARIYYEEGLVAAKDRESAGDVAPYAAAGILGTLLALSVYFSFLPPGETGLWALVFEPENTSLARQNSMALLPNRLPAYAYALTASLFVPVTVAALAWWRPHRVLWYAFRLVGLLAAVFLTCLTGARLPGVMTFLVFATVLLLKRDIKKYVLVFGLCGLLCMCLIAMISLRRENRPVADATTVAQYTARIIGGRATATPFATGLLSVDYNTRVGEPLGIRSVRPLAYVLGEDFVNHSGIVYKYYGNRLPSGSMNTGFLYAFQSNFGFIPGWVASLVLLACLDFLLLLFRRLPASVRIVFLGVLMVRLLSLISCNFTVSLFTHGILLCPLFAWMCYHLFKVSARSRLCERIVSRCRFPV